MEEQQSLWQFMAQQSDKLWQQTITHIGLTFTALLIAVLIGLPLGVVIARRQKFAAPVLGFAGILQTIPSIALFGIYDSFAGNWCLACYGSFVFIRIITDHPQYIHGH